jgi:hypothetical protein
MDMLGDWTEAAKQVISCQSERRAKGLCRSRSRSPSLLASEVLAVSAERDAARDSAVPAC